MGGLRQILAGGVGQPGSRAAAEADVVLGQILAVVTDLAANKAANRLVFEHQLQTCISYLGMTATARLLGIGTKALMQRATGESNPRQDRLVEHLYVLVRFKSWGFDETDTDVLSDEDGNAELLAIAARSRREDDDED